jgi:hypothetical protein
LAILKQEADRLLGDYIQKRRLEEDYSPEPSMEKVGSIPQQQARRDALSAIRQGSPPPVDWSVVQPIQRLQSGIAALDADMDRKLMMVYFENHLWNKFVDRYLHLLETEPQSNSIVMWGQCALACSENCGRRQEVLDALNHFVRFHKELKTVRGVTSVLEEQKAARHESDEPGRH